MFACACAYFPAQVAALVKRVMEGAVPLRVPLPVKLHVGPSWGELKEYHLHPLEALIM